MRGFVPESRTFAEKFDVTGTPFSSSCTFPPLLSFFEENLVDRIAFWERIGTPFLSSLTNVFFTG